MRFLLKRSQISERIQESILNRIFRILSVVGDVLSDAEELIVVALHNLIEGVHVALLAGVDKRQVIEDRPNGIGGRIASGSYRLHGRASFLNRIRLNQLP